MSKNILQENLTSIQVNGTFKGQLILTDKELVFTSNEFPLENHTVLVHKIIQVGFRSYYRMLIPYKFYFRTKSGKMYAYKTKKAKKWSDCIEKLIY